MLPNIWFTDHSAGSNDSHGVGCCTATADSDEALGHGQPAPDSRRSAPLRAFLTGPDIRVLDQPSGRSA